MNVKGIEPMGKIFLVIEGRKYQTIYRARNTLSELIEAAINYVEPGDGEISHFRILPKDDGVIFSSEERYFAEV